MKGHYFCPIYLKVGHPPQGIDAFADLPCITRHLGCASHPILSIAKGREWKRVVLISCTAVVIRPWNLAPVQCRGGARRALTDPTDIAHTKRQAPWGVGASRMKGELHPAKKPLPGGLQPLVRSFLAHRMAASISSIWFLVRPLQREPWVTYVAVVAASGVALPCKYHVISSPLRGVKVLCSARYDL